MDTVYLLDCYPLSEPPGLLDIVIYHLCCITSVLDMNTLIDFFLFQYKPQYNPEFCLSTRPLVTS